MQFLKSFKLYEDAKDEMRINDLVKKAESEDKVLQLANNMAKSITDKDKALRRYEAAKKILGDDNSVTIVFANRAQELGNRISVTKTVTNEDFNILKLAAKEAHENYIKQTQLFSPGDSYTQYSAQRNSEKKITFNDPWAMYFWNNNMLGQMSDGMWENSKKYANEWKYWNKLKPVFDPTKEYSSEISTGDLMNPKLVQQYALQTDAEFETVGKIAVLKDEKLLPLIKYNKVYNLEKVASMENAKKIADEYNIPLNSFLAFLWEPGLTHSQVKKLVADAHTSILGAMQS